MNENKPTILIVDDNPINLEVLTTSLEGHGFTILVARDGESALQKTAYGRPDLILLDLLMPTMDGFETCRRLKADETTQDIPVIFITALSEMGDEVKGFDLGAVDYITKPFQVEKVVMRVKTHLTLRSLQKDLEQKNRQLQQEIDERKQIEAALRESATALEVSNEELKIFTYIVSHDLRAPMVNLRGFTGELRYILDSAQDALNNAISEVEETQQRILTTAFERDIPEALNFIDSAVNRMDNLTNAILKLSRLGRREFDFEVIDMNRLTQDIVQTFAHQIEQKQVKVSVSELPEIVADQISMEQIIANLLSNAINYLTLDRPGEIEISAESAIPNVTFHVWDNGRGIAEKDIQRVFEIFRRVGKQDVPGEGMGLAYVQTLVRRQGGRIWCESKLGEGSKFSFTISKQLSNL